MMHTIASVKPAAAAGRLNLTFDYISNTVVEVDLSAMLAQGGVFEPLRDPARFASVKIGPRGRTLIWKLGGGADDVVDLCADALWLMAHPVDTNPAPSQQLGAPASISGPCTPN